MSSLLRILLSSATLLGCALVQGAAAQVVIVSGTVVDSVRGVPRAGVRVTLEPSGSPLTTSVTDSAGRFVIRGVGPPVDLSLSAMGFVPWSRRLQQSGQIDVGRIHLQPAPIDVDGLEVSGESRCDASPERLAVGYELMDRIRPDLRQIAANDRREDIEYVVELVRTVRRPRRAGRDRSGWTLDTTRVRLPFAMAGPDVAALDAEGFAAPVSDTVNEYRSPDAAWFASHQFLESYCVAATEADAEDGEGRGIRFWPKKGSSKVGVRGTIWLTEEERPAIVDFRYTSLASFVRVHELPSLLRYYQIREGTSVIPMRPLAVDEERHGGQLTFSEVTEGVPMTTAWSVRGVRLAHRALWKMGDLEGVWPRTAPLVTSARVIALIPRQ